MPILEIQAFRAEILRRTPIRDLAGLVPKSFTITANISKADQENIRKYVKDVFGVEESVEELFPEKR